jgi:hypothetical protein
MKKFLAVIGLVAVLVTVMIWSCFTTVKPMHPVIKQLPPDTGIIKVFESYPTSWRLVRQWNGERWTKVIHSDTLTIYNENGEALCDYHGLKLHRAPTCSLSFNDTFFSYHGMEYGHPIPNEELFVLCKMGYGTDETFFDLYAQIK